MGGSESSQHKENSAERYFSNAEMQKIQPLLQKMVDEKSRISSEKLHQSLKDRLLSSDLRSRLFEYLTFMSSSSRQGRTGHVTRNEFILFLAQVFKGNSEQLAPVVITLASGSPKNASKDQLKQLLVTLLPLASRTLSQMDVGSSWHLASEFTTHSFADYLLSELSIKDGATMTPEDLEMALMRVPYIQEILRLAFHQIFPITDMTQSLLPICNSAGRSVSTIIDVWSVACLNQSVPHEYRVEWRPLFNSKTQGESFATMLRSAMNCGPTILLIRDTDSHVFGGFASESWTMKPKFYGSSHCFLFSITPHMAIYSPTGYNENFMYLNQSQQTLPNGLGMGGQFNYFGLYLSPDYGSGQSKAEPKCTTYASPQLSASADFKIDHMEVWGIGPLKKPDGDEEESGQGRKKGVLNTNEELQNLVEMAGRRLVSKEIRAADQRQEHDEQALKSTSHLSDTNT